MISEAKRLYNKEYQARNRERLNAYRRARARRQDVSKKFKVYKKAWQARNAEHVRKTNQLWYAELKRDPVRYAEHLAKQREATKRRPDLRRQREKRWRDNKHDTYKLKRSRRKARLKGASGHFTSEQWIARFRFYGECCAYCCIPLTLNSTHIDHIIPVACGGTNWPSNLAPACCSCNCSKRHKRWIPKQPKVLATC